MLSRSSVLTSFAIAFYFQACCLSPASSGPLMNSWLPFSIADWSSRIRTLVLGELLRMQIHSRPFFVQGDGSQARGRVYCFCFSGWFCFSFVLFLRLSYLRERERESKTGGGKRERDSRRDSVLGVEPDARLDPTTMRS